VILSVGYKKEIIIDYFGTMYKSVKLIYSEECEPLGTGGATRIALEKATGKLVYVINGDTYFDIDLKRLFQFHDQKKSFSTIAIKKMANTKEYGNVLLNEDMRIIGFDEKKPTSDYISGGVYIFKKGTFDNLDIAEKFSIEKDYFMKYFQSKKMYGYISDDYFIDIGTPKNYRYAENQLLKRLGYKKL
jgi:D-glycero-alpha-D-manno-heptose 1-phosphate guanylyltransferase